MYDAEQPPDLPATLDNATTVTADDPALPRLRQAVLAATDLDAAVTLLGDAIGLGEPFRDPGVGLFGLHNAVFALRDTFLEVVSPTQPGTSAGRLLSRRGDDCGYMLMFQVADLAAARERAAMLGIREVFEVDLDDISEVHLHPADIGGAIVSLSAPVPATSWRWGGPDWAARAAPGDVSGVTVAVADPEAVAERWRSVIGGLPGVQFVRDDRDLGPVEIAVRNATGGATRIGGVRVGEPVTE